MNVYNLTLKENHTPEEMHTLVMLSFQRSLLGYIKKNVRAIFVSWNNVKDIKLVVILDEHPTPLDTELVSEMTGEVYGDFPYPISIKEECIYDLSKPFKPTKYMDENYKYSAVAFLRCEE